MIQVSFTSHNATKHSSIVSPYNSAIPFSITIFLRHLEWLSTLIVDTCSFIGSLRDNSSHSKHIRLLLLVDTAGLLCRKSQNLRLHESLPS